MIGISIDIPEVAARGGHIIAPGFVATLPSSSQAASIFLDFTTEGTTNQYWTGSTQPAGFSAWLTAMGGTFTRASSANYFQSGLMVTASSGQLRFPTNGGGTPTGMRLTGAQTELLLNNRDLSNASWTATNVTATKNQTGIDGATNAASSITASAGNGTVLQSLTRGAANRISGAWVKRLVGSGTINMSQDNGATWTAVTVTGAYTFVNIPSQNTSNPIIGFQIVTNGDSIAVDFVSHREQVSASNGIADPIATAGATVTQAADRITFPWSNGTNLAILAYIQNAVFSMATSTIIGGDNASAGAFITVNDATHFGSYNGGTNFTIVAATNFANLNKVMQTGNATNRKLVMNNGTNTASVTGNGAAFSNFVLGGYAGGTTNNFNGDLARLAVWAGAFASNTDMGTLTT